MSISWDWFQIKEVEFFTASDPETPDGFYPRGGWWRITTETDAVLFIGEMGDPPLVN
jgi:hypothetical protein